MSDPQRSVLEIGREFFWNAFGQDAGLAFDGVSDADFVSHAAAQLTLSEQLALDAWLAGLLVQSPAEISRQLREDMGIETAPEHWREEGPGTRRGPAGLVRFILDLLRQAAAECRRP